MNKERRGEERINLANIFRSCEGTHENSIQFIFIVKDHLVNTVTDHCYTVQKWILRLFLKRKRRAIRSEQLPLSVPLISKIQ